MFRQASAACSSTARDRPAAAASSGVAFTAVPLSNIAM
jgi:hypothetical protein